MINEVCSRRVVCRIIIGLGICLPCILKGMTTIHHIEGRWSARILRDRVRLRLTIREPEDRFEEWDWTQHFDWDAFTDLEMDEDGRFNIIREAGTIDFSGTFTGKRGKGHFVFNPGEDFRSLLQKKGLEKLTDKCMLKLCLMEVDGVYVQGLNDLDYSDISTSRLIKLGIHGVSLDYIREIRSMGFEEMNLARLTKFRIHGLDKAFVEGLENMGYSDLCESELLQLSIHGVTDEYIREVRSMGFEDLSLSQIRKFKIHGVSNKFILEMEALGYKNLSPSELVKCRIHGVTPRYINRLRADGFEDLTLSRLIKYRIHGIEK